MNKYGKMQKINSIKWSPTAIKSVKRNNILSSTNPILILTDQGEGYFKALGNKEGPQVLACEYVGTSLAKLLGLAIFQYCIFHFSGYPEITFSDGSKAQSGKGFLTKAESGNSWDGSEKMLSKITNKDDITKLVCLDTWVRNQDRYYPRKNEKSRRNFDNVFLSKEIKNGIILKAFDFTHAFREKIDVTTKIVQTIDDQSIYGLFPEFQKYFNKDIAIKTCQKLKTIKQKQVQSIINDIPKEWEIDLSVREAWLKFIMDRANFLSENFLKLSGLQPHTQQTYFSFKEE
jgi:hypothetical protein